MRKINTLKKNYEFRYVLSKGKYYRGKYLTIYIKNNKSNENFIGIAINTKMGKAVKRNRVKRLIREGYSAVKNQLLKGNCIVFLWNKETSLEEASYFEIKKEIFNIMKKAELLEE